MKEEMEMELKWRGPCLEVSIFSLEDQYFQKS